MTTEMEGWMIRLREEVDLLNGEMKGAVWQIK